MTSHPAHYVTVRHNFETGHRLPHLPGKCQSLHGHSWNTAVTVGTSGPLPHTGVLVEFATLKKALRSWIDTHLDHGLMLGTDDPLAPLLNPHGKVFLFGNPDSMGTAEAFAAHLAWPTVEAVAEVLAAVTESIIPPDSGCTVYQVRVTETAVNEAAWVAP